MLNDIISSQFDLKRIERLLKIQHALDLYSIIAITSNDGTITYANKEFCRISKYSEDELIGQNHRILKSGFHSDSFYAGLWKTISSGHIWRGEVKNKAKDGTFYWVKTIIVPLLDGFGKPTEYVSIRTDITKEKEMQEKLAESTDRLLKAERFSAIGEISSRLAHDLRNPLSIIKMESDLLNLKNKNDEQIVQSCQKITKSIVRISDQIESVLHFVRTKQLRLEQTGILAVIEHAVSQITVPNNIKVILPSCDVSVVCDVQQIETVIENVVTNSIQAIRDYGSVTIRLTDEGNVAHLEIEDTGDGIHDDMLTRIFEPLFTTKRQGTGLGLASVKKIIEQHRGTVSVKNNPTTFSIKIPKDCRLEN